MMAVIWIPVMAGRNDRRFTVRMWNLNLIKSILKAKFISTKYSQIPY